jgi:hypothetical protein
MRAQFINETFKEESDPIKDMDIGDPVVKFFEKDKILYFLEVTPPSGQIAIFGKGYASKQSAFQAYNRQYYTSYGRSIKGHKKQGYKFRIITVKISQNIKSVEEI